jgi:AcrR family transcriptional regulator
MVEAAGSGTRSAVVAVAARLLAEHGLPGVTTRAVAAGAGVQAPTIYRLFGDKDGLVEAVAEHVMTTHVARKAAVVEAASADDVDPVDDLRAGWQAQVDFGLAHPALFALLSDPGRAARSAAAQAGLQVLRDRVHRIALAGRLRTGEQRAVDLVHAAGTGAVLTLLATPAERRDPGLADDLLEAVLARVVTDVPPEESSGVLSPAVALRAGAPGLDALTPAERGLLAEWLDRVVAGAPR